MKRWNYAKKGIKIDVVHVFEIKDLLNDDGSVVGVCVFLLTKVL